MTKVYAFVPAKGSSERIENKNMRFLDGERLYIRALKTLLQCKEIDQVFLDTESAAMYELADYLPITFMQRDPVLASNQTDGHKMLLNEVACYPDADIYVQLLCTSPFIRPETIDEAIRALKSGADYDSAILMKKEKNYFWSEQGPEYNIEHIPNSVDLPDTLTESMGLYVIRKDAALRYKRRYGAHPLHIYGKAEELVDVNTHEDLEFAEQIAMGIRSQYNRQLRLIKHFVSSPALSDLLDDMAIEKGEPCGAVLNGFQANIDGAKLLGRANTLRLRTLRDGEDFRGIYEALNSYEGISDNDIIIVDNEEPEYAYFGDLNARLAISSGASGVVVNGVSRDRSQTCLLQFPVFCKGYNAKDVRRRATVDYINKPVHLNGVKISPKDLIFIDESSMVVIYAQHEQEVIQRVLQTVKNEKEIINDILDRKSIRQIIHERGAF